MYIHVKIYQTVCLKHVLIITCHVSCNIAVKTSDHYLTTLWVITDSGKNHQWLLKIMDVEFGWEKWYLHGWKVSPLKILINYKGKFSPFTMEESRLNSGP
jgi:hypothetical protein